MFEYDVRHSQDQVGRAVPDESTPERLGVRSTPYTLVAHPGSILPGNRLGPQGKEFLDSC